MSGIRPLQRDDVPHVASLYEFVSRSGSRVPSPGLAAYFERTCLDHPWFDPELPSLVYEDEDERVVGFIASHVRRLRFDGRPIRLACGGQMVTEPEVRTKAVGAFLLQKYLSGPQDLTITDTAGELTRHMWVRLGGVTTPLSAISWTRVFRPWRFAGDYLLQRRDMRAASRAARPVWSLLDAVSVRLPGASFRPQRPPADAEPLRPEALAEHLPPFASGLRVYPDYDKEFLRWLFREMAETRTYGELVGCLVRGTGGRVLGWYVYYLLRGGVSQVAQIVAEERDAGAVLDHLFHHVQAHGAAAVQGRVESRLLEPLARRGCIFRWYGESLIHSTDSDLLSAILGGRALLTRLEGEWWMGHHLEPFA